MKILLDTHILIWFHTRDSELSEKAWKILLNPENEIFYSSVNVWETQIKYLKHKDEINFSGAELDEFCKKARLQCLNVEPKHVLD